MKEAIRLDFTFISKYLTVIKKDREVVFNIWRPSKEGKKSLYVRRMGKK